METTAKHISTDNAMRALSHDIGANFMLMESSFSQLRRSLQDVSMDAARRAEIDDQFAYIDACMKQSKRFLGELGELARGGELDMTPERVNLGDVVESVVYEQRNLLVRSNINVRIQKPLPTLWCNGERLKQVVTNLIRNAALHGCDRSDPRITVAATDADGETTGFLVHDNGPGIDPLLSGEIFMPGRRLDGAHAEGSGMGLAIVKRLIEQYGGRVFIDPERHQGTAFVVQLPNEPVPERSTGRTLTLDGQHEHRRAGTHAGNYPRRPKRSRH